MVDLDEALRARLSAAGVNVSALFGPGLSPWEAWLRLHAHCGRRATLIDLYELEAASRGLRPEELTAPDRRRLTEASMPIRREQVEVVPGSGRPADPHEVTSYDPAWQQVFRTWHEQLAAALDGAATRIEHIGSTSVPGLAAKPIIDILISVPDINDEKAYLCRAKSTGLTLHLRERGHRFLWPPAVKPRDVHVHICGSGSTWEHNHLLFRDYLRAHPATCENYARLKQELITRWHHDRKAVNGQVAVPGGGQLKVPHPSR